MENVEKNNAEGQEKEKKIFDSINKLMNEQFFGSYGHKNEEIVKAIKDTLDKNGIDTSEFIIEGTEYEENSPEDEKNTSGTIENGIRVSIKKGDTEILSHDFKTNESSY